MSNPDEPQCAKCHQPIEEPVAKGDRTTLVHLKCPVPQGAQEFASLVERNEAAAQAAKGYYDKWKAAEAERDALKADRENDLHWVAREKYQTVKLERDALKETLKGQVVEFNQQVAALKERLARAKESVNPDITNAQYHAQVGKLWATIQWTETLYPSVFDAAIAEIQDLKAEVGRLREVEIEQDESRRSEREALKERLASVEVDRDIAEKALAQTRERLAKAEGK